MNKRVLLGALVGFSLGVEVVQGASKVLENGLKVVVVEDHRAPVVTSQVWYKVGSVDETSGKTGISHMLEHMMFKGTTTLPPGRFSEIIAENGGDDNAFTSRDYTAYYQNIAKEKLGLLFELEAERMHQLKLSQEEFIKEQQVVAEERRQRTDDNPVAKLRELFNAAAFISSGYHHPVVGWMDDIQQYTLDDLQAYYDKYYAPNNATLVVAGDVKSEKVFALAKKYFGEVPTRELGQMKQRIEQTQQGLRRVELKLDTEVPVLLMGYKVPTFVTAKNKSEAYALEVLAYVLDGGQSARLPSELMRGSEIAASASAGYSFVGREQSLFTLSGSPVEGHTLEELEAAFKKQVKRLQTELVNEEELKRIKAQVIAAEVYEKDSLFYRGMSAGILETVGLDYTVLDDYEKQIQAVTPKQLKAVANKYLIETGLTIGALLPLDEVNEEDVAQ